MQSPLVSYSRLFFGIIGIAAIGIATLWMARELIEDLGYSGTGALDTDPYLLYSLILAAVNISVIVIICIKIFKKIQ